MFLVPFNDVTEAERAQSQTDCCGHGVVTSLAWASAFKQTHLCVLKQSHNAAADISLSSWVCVIIICIMVSVRHTRLFLSLNELVFMTTETHPSAAQEVCVWLCVWFISLYHVSWVEGCVCIMFVHVLSSDKHVINGLMTSYTCSDITDVHVLTCILHVFSAVVLTLLRLPLCPARWFYQ